jgi:hypothetical protein
VPWCVMNGGDQAGENPLALGQQPGDEPADAQQAAGSRSDGRGGGQASTTFEGSETDKGGEGEALSSDPYVMVRWAKLAPVGVLWFGATMAAGRAITFFIYAGLGGVFDIVPLRSIADLCLGCATLMVAGFMPSLRRVVQPGGTLEALGYGTARLSAPTRVSLQRWMMVLCSFALWIFLSAGVKNTTREIVGIWDYDYELLGILESGRAGHSRPCVDDPAQHANCRIGYGFNGLLALVLGPAGCAWYFCMKLSARLVSDEVLETCKQIDVTEPSAPEWNDVVLKCQTLIRHTLPTLSRGFGDGLLAMSLACAIAALGSFSHFLRVLRYDNQIHTGYVMLACIETLIPLGFAYDVARASSDCDALVESLNDKRVDAMSPEAHQRLALLETSLDRCNAKQGLGFVIPGGQVVDKARLRNMFFALFSVGSVIVPVVYAMQPEPSILGAGTCTLSEAQAMAIRGVVAATPNASACSYNMTVGSVLMSK